MRILFVTQDLPDPKGGGSPQRAFLHLEALRQLGDVTMVLPQSPVAYPEYGVAEIVGRQEPTMTEERKARHETARSRVGRPLRALLRLNYVDGRARPQDRRAYRKRLSREYDLILAFRLRSAIWLESVLDPRSLGGAMVLDLDDIESRVFERCLADAPNVLWKWKFERELAWLKRSERRVVKQWDVLSLCSQADSDAFKGMTGCSAWVVPNATQFKPAKPETDDAPSTVLFVGTFSYFANAQGVEWFVKDVWPIVRRSLGDTIQLQLVGLRPSAEILALAQYPGITVAGDVPDVDPYYARANIVIAPIHTGSGTRIKLIEAAAKGRAIVTTTLGCEGLGFVDGVHAEIADDPEAFAERIIALASQPSRRARLAATAHAHATERFSRDGVVADLAAKLRAFVVAQTGDPR